MMQINQLQEQWESILDDLLPKMNLQSGDLVVIGCSSSEVMGEHIGKSSNAEVGEMIVELILDKLTSMHMHLAVQCCEHLNRALVMEHDEAVRHGYTIVNAVPALNAGGAAAVAAFASFDHPVLVEHITARAGIDIGDTFIGMHIQHVQVPVRPDTKQLGEAHITAVTSRPKYIGGARAHYA